MYPFHALHSCSCSIEGVDRDGVGSVGESEGSLERDKPRVKRCVCSIVGGRDGGVIILFYFFYFTMISLLY